MCVCVSVCLHTGRPPGPEMEYCTDRESYSLAAGLALGMVCLGVSVQIPSNYAENVFFHANLISLESRRPYQLISTLMCFSNFHGHLTTSFLLVIIQAAKFLAHQE